MQIRLEHHPEPVLTPITPWVHKGVDAAYYTATVFDPPRPKPVLGKGYPLWVIEHRGRSLFFSSPEEIAHVIDILGRKILPVTRDLGQPYRAGAVGFPREKHLAHALDVAVRDVAGDIGLPLQGREP